MTLYTRGPHVGREAKFPVPISDAGWPANFHHLQQELINIPGLPRPSTFLIGRGLSIWVPVGTHLQHFLLGSRSDLSKARRVSWKKIHHPDQHEYQQYPKDKVDDLQCREHELSREVWEQTW